MLSLAVNFHPRPPDNVRLSASPSDPADEGNGAERSLSLMAVNVFFLCFHPNDLKSLI